MLIWKINSLYEEKIKANEEFNPEDLEECFSENKEDDLLKYKTRRWKSET